MSKAKPKKRVGNLTDFVDGVTPKNPLDIEIAVDDRGRVVLFYDKPFNTPISWFEYDTTQSKLDFILGDEAEKPQYVGMPLMPEISRHMHNTHQILAVLLDDKTGQAIKGDYIPLIMHQS